MKKRLEYHLQHEIILWANANRPDIVVFTVPNEAARSDRNITVLKGVSDLVVVLPQKVIFVELKTAKGVQSKYQKIFQNRVEKLGHEYYIVRSLEEFKLCISTK